MKNSLSIQKLGFLLFAFSLVLKINEGYTQCVKCLTQTLDIGTGFDQEINAYYAQGVQDQYWQISSGPGGLAYPMCAFSHGQFNKILWTPPTSNSTAIGLSTLNAPGNTSCQGDHCNNNDPLYKFERHICVNTTRFETSTNQNGEKWANLIFRYLADLNVINITLYDPNNNVVVQQTGCDNQSGGGYFFSWGGNVHTGVYTLSITVANDWDCAGIIPQIVGQTPMRLEVSGAFGSSFNIFTDNNHFGKNFLCSSSYPPGPEFSLIGNNCIDTLIDTLAYDTISLYHPFNNTYVIFGTSGTISPITMYINSNGDTLGAFTATIGTDTIISTDAKGCKDTVIFGNYIPVRPK